MKKNKTGKKCILGLIVIFSIILLVSNVSAYKRLCLKNGESVPSKSNPRYTCHASLCEICVTDNNYPTHPGFCNSAGGCGVIGPGSNDLEPPAVTINSPQEGAIYNARSVAFDITMNEKSSILYIDNINGRGMWKKLISNALYFRKGVSFSDGAKDITLKFVDNNGNSVEIVKKFYVDSTKPKIKTTLPAKGFADGNFKVTFSEMNPKELKLLYGNMQRGERTLNVDLGSCISEKGNTLCSVNVNLNDFNNQELNYKFRLTDIANNVVDSKQVTLSVDNVKPVINNEESMYTIQGNAVLFNIGVSEQNFYEVSFMDNSAARPKFNKLCSSLKNSFCIKKQTFSIGNHQLDIKVSDKAGNYIIKSINVDIE
jgi:hypothetical protein